ncbi:hypothetical protein AVEN_266698-1 [Araneus ventricosus]|uniref:Uncharacterized protein n=1 Tax=Araneus ventricosus TaxID=182803 RepID=A0A4Y2PV34_ARAVE|nr:hypothetical protein AVEN_266698-1 [Araneus ventricosus]
MLNLQLDEVCQSRQAPSDLRVCRALSPSDRAWFAKTRPELLRGFAAELQNLGMGSPESSLFHRTCFSAATLPGCRFCPMPRTQLVLRLADEP